jgi:hypothetical protein
MYNQTITKYLSLMGAYAPLTTPHICSLTYAIQSYWYYYLGDERYIWMTCAPGLKGGLHCSFM